MCHTVCEMPIHIMPGGQAKCLLVTQVVVYIRKAMGVQRMTCVYSMKPNLHIVIFNMCYRPTDGVLPQVTPSVLQWCGLPPVLQICTDQSNVP